MNDFKQILVQKTGSKSHILLITVNRERSLNALDRDTIHELQSTFSYHWTDNSLACAIITGAGEKAFVAGADITELQDLDVRTGADLSLHGLYLMKTIQNFPRPVIAAINGFALGGGCELAMACDIRIASEKAKLGQPEVNLGLIPGYGGTQRLPRLVGMGKAKQLIFTGELIGAAEAYRIGLVDEVCAPDQLMNRAMEMAELIASKAPLAVTAAKEAINRGMEVSLSVGCDLEKGLFGQVCGSDDKNEGTQAFLEKRKAEFRGR